MPKEPPWIEPRGFKKVIVSVLLVIIVSAVVRLWLFVPPGPPGNEDHDAYLWWRKIITVVFSITLVFWCFIRYPYNK